MLEQEPPRGRPGTTGEAPSGPVQFPGRRVLVVDDSRLNRTVLCAMLRAHGCEGDEAADGAAAVEAVSRTAYDLVLMDVHMPGMDGPGASRAIRDAGRTDLPILALTATRTPEQARRCAAAGMNGQLPKPISPQQLAAALAAVFASNAPEAPAKIGDPPVLAMDDEGEPERRRFEASMGVEAALRFARLFQQQLREGFRLETYEALEADAHKTAGSAGLMGFPALAEASGVLEQVCGERRDYARALVEVRRLIRQADASLDRWCSRLARPS